MMEDHKANNESKDGVTRIAKWKGKAEGFKENTGKVVKVAKDKVINVKDIFSNINETDVSIASEDRQKLQDYKEIIESNGSKEDIRILLEGKLEQDKVDNIMRHIQGLMMVTGTTLLAALALIIKNSDNSNTP